MKKILLIVILIVAVVLIGTGIFFGLTASEDGKITLLKPENEEVVNLDEEIEKNEEVHSENIHKYKTIEDATLYLSGIYETDQVTVSYNDGRMARIKVFADTDEEVVYIYQINGGDLVIE